MIESLTIGLCSIRHPLCEKAIMRLQSAEPAAIAPRGRVVCGRIASGLPLRGFLGLIRPCITKSKGRI